MDTTSAQKTIAVINYVLNGDWRQLRLAVAGPACREAGWYYYARNGSSVAVRSPGKVAQTVLAVAEALGFEPAGQPRGTSWCAKWPRTVTSVTVELEGCAVFDAATNYVRSLAAAREGE